MPTASCPDPRSYLVLLLTVASYGVVNNVVFSLLPLIGMELGLGAPQVTLIGSCAALMVFLVSPWWGRKSDEWGRRRSILIGVVGYCISALLLVLLFTLGRMGALQTDELYVGLFASRLLQAFLIAAMLPAITAYVIDITAIEDRAVGLSQTGAAHGLGAIAGPSLVVLATWHLLMPLYVAVLLALLIAVLVTMFLNEPRRQAAHAGRTGSTRLGYFDLRYRHFLLAGVFIYMAMAVSTQMMGFYLPGILSLATVDAAVPLGFIQASMAAATVFGQLVLVRQLSWPPRRLLLAGIPAMALGFLFLSVAGNLWMLFVGVVMLGLGLGVGGPGFSASVSLSVSPAEQGAIAGFLAACPALGYVLGPLGAGLLYEIHPRIPFALVAIVLVLVWPMLWRHKA